MTLQKANIKPQSSGSSAVANHIHAAEKMDSSAEDKKQISPETILTQKSIPTSSGSSGLPPSGTDNSSKRNNNQPLKPVIQTKLSVSSPGDEYEQEADEVASQVMTMPEREVKKFTFDHAKNINSRPTIQQKEEEEDEAIRRKQIFRKSDEAVNSPPSWLENQLINSKGNGKSLPGATMASMESRFDKDFSTVQIHTDPNAIQMSKELGAQAFTHGNDIYFNSGKYDTESNSGKHLLAHELTHVVQQKLASPAIMRKKAELPSLMEGQGLYTKNSAYYIIVGRWRSDDTLIVFMRRSFEKWIKWRFGNLSTSLYKRMISLHESLDLKPYNDVIPELGEFYGYEIDIGIIRGFSRMVGENKQMLEEQENDPKHEVKKVGSGTKEAPEKSKVEGSKETAENEATIEADLSSGYFKVTALATAEDIEFLKRILQEIFGAGQKAGKNRPPVYISLEDIKSLYEFDKIKDKEELIKSIRAIGQSRESGKEINISNLLETIRALVDMQKSAIDLSYTMKEKTNASQLIANRPVRGDIMSFNESLVPGMEARYTFVQRDSVDAFRVPHVSIKWFATKRGGTDNKTVSKIAEEVTNYIEVSGQTALNDKIFNFKFTDKGNYEIHAFVNHNFYQPAHFVKIATVKTEKERLAEEEAKADIKLGKEGSRKRYRFKDVDEESFNIKLGLGLAMGGQAMAISPLLPESKYSEGLRSEGLMGYDQFSDEAANFKLSRRQLDKQIEQIDEMITYYSSKDKAANEDILKWAKERRERLRQTADNLTKLQGTKGFKPILCQAFFVSRKTEYKNGQLKLVSWFTYQPDEKGRGGTYYGHLFDHSELVRTDHFHFEASDTDYNRMMEKLFFEISSTYPLGRMSFTYQVYETFFPTRKYVRLERKTDTLLKDIKETVFSPTANIIVNTLALVLSVFPPTMPVGIALSIAYNGSAATLDLAEASRSGTVRASNYLNLGLVALDLIPILGKATKLVNETGIAIRVINVGETLTQLAGNAYILTDTAFHEIEGIRDKLVVELSRVEAEIKTLIDNNAPSDLIYQKQNEAESIKKEIRDSAVKVLSDIVEQQGLTIASQHAVKHLITSGKWGQPKPKVHPESEIQQPRKESLKESISPESKEAPKGIIERPTEAAVRTLGKPKGDPVLAQGLPPHLQSEVPVIKTSEQGIGVEVVYETGSFGQIINIFLKVGKDAEVTHIQLHAKVVELLHGYQGVSGMLKVTYERLLNLIRKGNEKALPGSPAFNSLRELEKLPPNILKIAEEIRKLDPVKDTERINALKDQKALLESEIERYSQLIDQLEFEKGPQSIAAKSIFTTNAEAKKLQYPQPPSDHYYYQAPDGSFKLRRYASSNATPKQVVTDSKGNKQIRDAIYSKVWNENLPASLLPGEEFTYAKGTARAYRDPTGKIVIESRLGKNIGRQHFETKMPLWKEAFPPNIVISDVLWERAHSQGQGTGHESPFGILYAPSEVNQIYQAKGIEANLMGIARWKKPGVEVTLRTETRAHWGTSRLKEITYRVEAKIPGDTRSHIILEATITVGREKIKPKVDAEIHLLNKDPKYVEW